MKKMAMEPPVPLSSVLVIGSINMDLVATTLRYPKLGETVFGQQFAAYPGGKGANQAVAAARLGAQVTLLGCVGNDTFALSLKSALHAENIQLDALKEIEGASGLAMIILAQGDNAITVVPGANQALMPADLDKAEATFAQADVILAQLEVPLATVEQAAVLAKKYNKPFILNPAPASKLPESLLNLVTLLTPNEHELALILEKEQAHWMELLQQLPGRALMTRGKEGATFIRNDKTPYHQPAFLVEPVDSTGAGDTFNGALAAFWGQGLPEAMRLACAAAALSVTKQGAQSGMPTLAQLQAFLKE